VDKRALVIRFSSLGDVALASCVIEPLVLKGYSVSFLTYKPYHELFKDDTRVNAIGIEREKVFETLENYRGFDLYVDLQKNLKTLYMRLRLGGRWVSYNKESLRRRLSVHFESFRTNYSVVKAYLKAVGESDGRPKIQVSEDRISYWRSKLGNDFISIGPGARYRTKKYPYFRELSQLLVSQSYKVVILGDEKDRMETEGFAGINLCNQISLVDLLAVLKLSRAFIGNDSGLLHLARSVGTRCVQIYGGTHPTLGFSLAEDEGFVLFKNLPCQPCHIHGLDSCKFGTYQCLQFDPEYVLSYVKRIV